LPTELVRIARPGTARVARRLAPRRRTILVSRAVSASSFSLPIERVANACASALRVPSSEARASAGLSLASARVGAEAAALEAEAARYAAAAAARIARAELRRALGEASGDGVGAGAGGPE